MDADGRTSEALKLEQIRRAKGLEEIGKQTREQVQQIIAGQRSRGVLSSGGTVRRIASAHFERAKKSIDQALVLRRGTIEVVPELAEDSVQWQVLLETLEKSVDTVAQSLPEHIRSIGSLGETIPNLGRTFEGDVMSLKAYARREIEILRGELKLLGRSSSK